MVDCLLILCLRHGEQLAPLEKVPEVSLDFLMMEFFLLIEYVENFGFRKKREKKNLNPCSQRATCPHKYFYSKNSDWRTLLVTDQ